MYASKVDVGELNGQELDSLYRSVVISGTNVTLKNPRFRSLTAKEIKLHGFINRIDLNEITRNAMKRAGDQVVTGNIAGTWFSFLFLFIPLLREA